MIFRRKPRPTRPTSSVPAGIPSGSGNAGESHPPPPASGGGSSPAPFDWADLKQARRLMTVPTDHHAAEEQSIDDLLEQAWARKKTVMATGNHTSVTTVVEHREAHKQYRTLPTDREDWS